MQATAAITLASLNVPPELRQRRAPESYHHRESQRQAATATTSDTDRREKEADIWHPATFIKAPPSFWVGYTYRLYPVSGRLRVRLTHTGILPERIQRDPMSKIVIKVKLVGAKSSKRVCMVRDGKLQKSEAVDLADVPGKTIHECSLSFTVYFDRGMFRRNKTVFAWTALLSKCQIVRETYEWKNIKFPE